MKSHSIPIFLLLFLSVASCASVSHGVKIYPQKVYLFVDANANSSRILTLPDIKNGYDVKPWSFLSKHDFTMKVTEGQVSEITSNQDSSTALALLQKIVEIAGELGAEALKQAAEAAKAAKVAKPVADVEIASSLGLSTGIYEFDEKGLLKRLVP